MWVTLVSARIRAQMQFCQMLRLSWISIFTQIWTIRRFDDCDET